MFMLRLKITPALTTRAFLLRVTEVRQAMNSSKPTKEQVRHWLDRQVSEHRPPPSPEQIRRELGWDLLKDERAGRRLNESDGGEHDN